ncbi:exosortase-associated protein EpsI, B-type [Massilia sp. DWR3-1-1]|uniref:exosortase-associated protein EpsI, B-type n=1 Tax=Massilia sp. DWR3-1-1 TaxID=2804559 RepID=UPI003CF01339
MSSRLRVSAAMALLMAAGAVGAWVATPTRRLADTLARVDIERLIPASFDGWQVDDAIAPLQVDPGQQRQLGQLYSQTLARTYRNARGDQVMLVIAYGAEQNDTMAVHKPDVCYPAQGFDIIKAHDGLLDTGFGVVPVARRVARQGRRYEPLTYWIRVGDTVDATGLQRKLTQLKYGMMGAIPDGLLFRISSFGPEQQAFPLQDQFARALLAALGPGGRTFVMGRAAPALAAQPGGAQ